MYTQCPECHIAFRVTVQVLQQAGGRVQCGGCNSPFNAVDYLSEEPPESHGEHDAIVDDADANSEIGESQAALDEETTDAIELPDSKVATDDNEDDTAPSFEERNTQLLKALDELAGPDEIRIEDTGIEWRVLGNDQELEQVAKDEEAPGDLSEPPVESDEADAQEEQRYDDSTPLPDDFGDEKYDASSPATPLSSTSFDDPAEKPEKLPLLEDAQVDLELDDPDEWLDLLDDVLGEQIAGMDDDDDPAIAEQRDLLQDTSNAALRMEAEEELAAIHNELSATMEPFSGAAENTPGTDSKTEDLQSDDDEVIASEELQDEDEQEIADQEEDDSGEEPVADESDEETAGEEHAVEDTRDHAEDDQSDVEDPEDQPSEAQQDLGDPDDPPIEDEHDLNDPDDPPAEDEHDLESGEEQPIEDALDLEHGEEQQTEDALDLEDGDEQRTEDGQDRDDPEEPPTEGEQDLEDPEEPESDSAEDEMDITGHDPFADSDAADDGLTEDFRNQLELIENSLADEPLDDEETRQSASPDDDDDDDDRKIDDVDVEEHDIEKELSASFEPDSVADESAAGGPENAGSRNIQDDLRRAMEDDEFAATMLGEDGSPMIETIIMEGDFVHGSIMPLQNEDEIETPLPGDLEEPKSLLDTYVLSRRSASGNRFFSASGKGAAAGIVILLLVLAGQYIHSSRELLATYGMFNQTIGPVYRALGRPVTPAWDIKGWQFETTNGSTDEGEQLLTIFSTLSNRSSQALPYPLVYISLTDRWEEIVGSRVLEPNEYLAGNPDPSKPVAPGNKFTAVISIAAPSAEVTGFKLNVCYRVGPGHLSCAIEDFK